MNLKTDLFLAWRYLKPKRNAVSFITCISVTGVILGVAVLIVVIAVMTGFTDEMKKKMLETMAHLQIVNPYRGYISKPGNIIDTVRESGAEASPIVRRPVLVQANSRFLPKSLAGIEPYNTNTGIPVSKYITSGAFSLETGEVLVGFRMASELGISPGDKLVVHSPERLSKMVSFREEGGLELNDDSKLYLPREFRVSGLFSVGKYDFDNDVIVTNIDDANELFGLPWGSATSIFVRIDDPFRPEPLQAMLKEKLPLYQIFSWKQLNEKFLGVLAVEKNMMYFLLVFIVLVAAFSISNTLVTVVLQKTHEIGLLKALGASPACITRIFILQGFFVGIMGTAGGIILGIAVVHWRMPLMYAMRRLTGMEIFPAEYYFFSELPASVVPHDIIKIAVISMLLCTLGALLPALRAARLDPSKALRYE